MEENAQSNPNETKETERQHDDTSETRISSTTCTNEHPRSSDFRNSPKKPRRLRRLKFLNLGQHQERRRPCTEPLTEFDEYGTELQKNARVWKVYVKETDKWDAELVAGWNRSLDVILLFAALFSACAAAFLVESSKSLRIQPDTSSQTLTAILQTLLLMANNTQSPGPKTSPDSTEIDFFPEHVDVLVNALWFLSFSLSLATSFIAILAKDWCHSFIEGRSGHPYLQTQRRQQKWDMLKYWKMPILLAVLPSCIHVALFLFAIGLCIALWHMHIAVAIPVIIVAGTVFAFYAMSSVAAMFSEAFPYPTILSKAYRYIGPRMLTRGFWLFAQILHLVAAILPYLLLRLLRVALDAIDSNPYTRLELRYSLSQKFMQMTGLAQPPDADEQQEEARVAPAGSPDPRNPHKWSLGAIFDLLVGPEPVLKQVSESLSEWIVRKTRWSRACDDPMQENVTSRALSWLIKHCETPQSVDIALQSIAGANKRIPPKPLQKCNAALAILRRLASSNVHSGGDAEIRIALYSRALDFLSASSKETGDLQNHNTGALEVLLWDMQAQMEINVADLITVGKFETSKLNVTALRVGSTIAPRSLRLLKGASHDADMLHHSVDGLITQEINNQGLLHTSALLSLAHATTLLLVFAPKGRVALTPNHCIRLAQPHLENDDDARMQNLKMALVTCALLQNRNANQGRPLESSNLGYVEEIVRALAESQSGSYEGCKTMLAFALQELSHSPQRYNLDHTHSGMLKPYIDKKRKLFRDNMLLELDSEPTEKRSQILAYIQALHSTYSLVQVGSPDPYTYIFLVESQCFLSPSPSQGWQLISKFRFPELSSDLVECLALRSLVRILEQGPRPGNRAISFFRTSQLWLLFTLFFEPSTVPQTKARNDLQLLLQQGRIHSILEQDPRERLATLMKDMWREFRPAIARVLGVYALRVMEIVLQSRGNDIPEEIEEGLRDIPEELRGLSSFTRKGAQSA